jgi:hypothetical protein
MRHALPSFLFGIICGAFATVAAAQRLGAHVPPPQPEKGDENFVPSTYMDYDQALTLGKLQLEEPAKPQPEPSLCEVARALRGNPDGTASATMAFSAIQGNDCQLVICRYTCRPVS